MPTDEQPTAHFYGYHISFDATGVEPVDHVLKAVADAGRGSHHTKNWAELGLEAEIQRAAHEAAAVFHSRDAEVRALRGDRDSYKDAFERVLHSVGVRDDEIEELEERIRKLREALEQ